MHTMVRLSPPTRVISVCICARVQRGSMARVLTRQRYIKWNKRLQKSTKPSTMSLVVSTLHIALVHGSTLHRLRVRGIGHFGLIFDQNLPFFKK